jgi:hypothetical protein
LAEKRFCRRIRLSGPPKRAAGAAGSWIRIIAAVVSSTEQIMCGSLKPLSSDNRPANVRK